jgi:phosphate/sulfate permease
MFAAVASSADRFRGSDLRLCVAPAFDFSNGFHDTANAVATAIYTNSLMSVQPVMLSGIVNFLGPVLGGVAVAFHRSGVAATGRVDAAERQAREHRVVRTD